MLLGSLLTLALLGGVVSPASATTYRAESLKRTLTQADVVIRARLTVTKIEQPESETPSEERARPAGAFRHHGSASVEVLSSYPELEEKEFTFPIGIRGNMLGQPFEAFIPLTKTDSGYETMGLFGMYGLYRITDDGETVEYVADLGAAIPTELAWDALRELLDAFHDRGDDEAKEKWLDRLTSTVPSDVFTAQAYLKIRGLEGRTTPDARTKTVLERIHTGSLAETALALAYFESLPGLQPDRGAILDHLEGAFEVIANFARSQNGEISEEDKAFYAGFRSMFAATLPTFENGASAEETTRMYELFLKVTRDPWGTVNGKYPIQSTRGRSSRPPPNTSILRMVANDPGPKRMERVRQLSETKESIRWRRGGWHTLRYFRHVYDVTRALSDATGDGADEILLHMARQPDQFKVIREFRDLESVWSALITRRPSELKEILMPLLRDPSLASPAATGGRDEVIRSVASTLVRLSRAIDDPDEKFELLRTAYRQGYSDALFYLADVAAGHEEALKELLLDIDWNIEPGSRLGSAKIHWIPKLISEHVPDPAFVPRLREAMEAIGSRPGWVVALYECGEKEEAVSLAIQALEKQNVSVEDPHSLHTFSREHPKYLLILGYSRSAEAKPILERFTDRDNVEDYLDDIVTLDAAAGDDQYKEMIIHIRKGLPTSLLDAATLGLAYHGGNSILRLKELLGIPPNREPSLRH
jgi:hypothetical protein